MINGSQTSPKKTSGEKKWDGVNQMTGSVLIVVIFYTEFILVSGNTVHGFIKR